jgi:hypothetical protein
MLEVNSEFVRMFRASEGRLLRHGYKNYFAAGHGPAHLAARDLCMAEHRAYEGEVECVRGDGTRFLAYVRLEPHPENPEDGPATHFYGIYRVRKELP